MMDLEALQKLVIDALEDIKAIDIKVLNMRDRSDMTDIMIIATGNTARQVKSLANNVVVKAKEAGERPLGIEGDQHGEWILVDLGDVVVHVMLPSVRDFYNLEKLWGDESPAAQSEE